MHKKIGRLLIVLSAFLFTGCAGYKIQALGDTEGTAFVKKGATVWHCDARKGAPKCKPVLN